MPLPRFTAQSVIDFLRSRRLLPDVSVNRLTASEVTRRNVNFVVCVDARPVLFVKQLQYATFEVVESLQREAQCYHAAQASAALASVRALMPRCLLFDAEHSVLVLEGLDGVSAADAHQRVGVFDPSVATLMGEGLARLHASSAVALRSVLRRRLPSALPWVLQPAAERTPLSRRAAFLSALEADGALARELAEVRGGWRRDTVIHGDTRPENFMLCRPADQGTAPVLRIVDWELADIGDAAWDCAGVMQHYWAEWVQVGSPEAARWRALRGALEGFWATYAEGRGADPRLDGPSFRRATRLTGARLVQTAYERFARDGAWTLGAQRCAAVARQLLTQTEGALAGFGVP